MERRLRLPDHMGKAPRRRDAKRERWLLTRKTWKYMSDAGRRLVPDGAANRPEDVPRIEAYFQEVCAKEPRFLLWRKSSFPGALPRPRRRKRPRGGSVRARSPDEEPRAPQRPTDLYIPHTSGGRFDIAKLRRDFFAAPAPAAPAARPAPDDESDLVELLRTHLNLADSAPGPADSERLLGSLRAYLARHADRAPFDGDADPARRALADHLARFSRGSDRTRAVQDLLTDRNALKRLYQDLRKPKPYRGARSGGLGGTGPGGFGTSGFVLSNSGANCRGVSASRSHRIFGGEGAEGARAPPLSPPPLIEVKHESLEERTAEAGTQTAPIPRAVLAELERAYRDKLEASTAPTSPTSPPGERKARRRSSVDHDDVSQSVSDTIKRYLRMARKKSVDADKADRFKRINYDKNLRNIKTKMCNEVDDHGLQKGCQTEEQWILSYRELRSGCESAPTSPTTPTSLSPGAALVRGSTPSPGVPAGGMQKSRSSSSVVQSVSKRLWRTRSRSSSRAAAAWTPQGSCVWADGGGRVVRLAECSLLTLSQVERRALQQAALASLHQILGLALTIPDENATVTSTKPKRRAYLLKRKALTTGFFDQSRTKEQDKEKESSSGSVFGVLLAQCVETERALRRAQHGGSRASLASLGALEKGDDSESCDSGEWGWSSLEEGGGGPRVPGLVTACLAHLRRHGLHTVGLFRVSSSKKRVRELREDWERNAEAALDAAVCPNDVATLLKEYLRDLPDPLLCRDLYHAFLQTQKLHNRQLQWEALRLLIQLLPSAHRDTLNVLLSFLSQLAAHSEDGHQPGNKMNAGNLATIFAPNILHKNKPNEAANAEDLSERTDVINVVRLLVERQAELWTLPAEMLHEAYIHLAHSQPHLLDSLLLRRAECQAEQAAAEQNSENAIRRVWSRETFLHGAAATGGPGNVAPPRRREEKSYSRRRARDSTDSNASLQSAMTIVTSVTPGASRVRRSEEWSGGAHSPALRTDSTPDSIDSASDYNETLGGSDDEGVITASLHIPAAFSPPSPRAPSAPPRRRSTSGSDTSIKQTSRDSAIGSRDSAAGSRDSGAGSRDSGAGSRDSGAGSRDSGAGSRDSAAGSRDSALSSACASSGSSPAASPPPAPLRVTVTAGEVKRPTDIDRIMALSRERNTSDARAVVLRAHDETSSATTVRTRTRTEQTTKREEPRREEVRREEGRREEARREESAKEERREGATLYKRGELISSARSPPT